MAQPQPPVYAITLNPAAPEQGVALVSFVGTPAVGVNFVALAAEQTEQVFHISLKTDAKKQILTGPVLIPDKQIARLSEKKELYYITFGAEVIEGLRDRFHEQNHTQATNLQHETPLEGNHVVESWIITDEANDKAYSLGFTAEQCPVGTWMASYKVPDKTLWDEQVETGNVQGFSMEGLLAHTTLSQQVLMEKTPRPANSGLFAAIKESALKLAAAVTKLSESDGDDTTSQGGEAGQGDEQKADEEEAAKVEPTALAEATYALPGGDVLTVSADTYALKKADGTEHTALSAVVEVKLESIEMADGTSLVYNPITRRLSTAEGKMVESGNYACKDGSYFEVSTSQYTYQIDKETYERSQKLSSVEVELAKVKTDLAAAEVKLGALPAAAPVKLTANDKAIEKPVADKPLKTHERYALAAVAEPK